MTEENVTEENTTEENTTEKNATEENATVENTAEKDVTEENTETQEQSAAPEAVTTPADAYKKVDISEGNKAGNMEVPVDSNIEKAMKILKRKLIKEGLFKELKLRRYYEKPSEKNKRKHKESMKKIRKEEARLKKNPYMYS